MSQIARLIQPCFSWKQVGNYFSFYLIFNVVLPSFAQYAYIPKTCTPGSGLGACMNNPHSVPESSDYWFQNAELSLQKNIANDKKIESVAKNVIFFIAHGMGVSTITASRIHKGQLEGHSGEETQLNFEQLPNVALAKTFCLDTQVADSACAATALHCGTLGNSGILGLTSNVAFGDCKAQMDKTNQITSALAWAQARGMATGIVTTTSVTHTIPGGAYAHIADKNWETDKDVKDSGQNSDDCDDIAEQLILGDIGKRINVILGGGRGELLPNSDRDIETGQPGLRTDGKNLIELWKHSKSPTSAKYIWNRQQLLNVDVSKTDYLLGLFAPDEMDYVLDANPTLDPTIAEMTKVAIDILSRNPYGYFLLVVGGNIDAAHHSNFAQKAFIETIAMDDAILTATSKTSEEDTLLLVATDHSSVMTISGYPERGNPILGIAGVSDVDGLPYTTISYANGPGYKHPRPNGERYDITNDPLFDKEYRQMAGLPMIDGDETHGGEDVTVLSRGPFSRLLEGVNHQSLIPHVIAYAACLDIPGKSNLKGPHCPPIYVGGHTPGTYGWSAPH